MDKQLYPVLSTWIEILSRVYQDVALLYILGVLLEKINLLGEFFNFLWKLKI